MSTDTPLSRAGSLLQWIAGSREIVRHFPELVERLLKSASLNVINLRLVRKILLQAQHEQPVVLTRFKPRRVILKGLPAHDQIEHLGRFDALCEQMSAVTLGAFEQRLDLGKRTPERFSLFFVNG